MRGDFDVGGLQQLLHALKLGLQGVKDGESLQQGFELALSELVLLSCVLLVVSHGWTGW